MRGLLIWLVRVFVLAIVARAIGQLFAMMRGGAVRGVAGRGQRSGGALVRDPQCGTYVPASRAVTLSAGGRTTQFCSTACRDAYLAQADHRADAGAAGR